MKRFLTGFAVGVGAGLLIAPAAGSETGKKVVEKIGNATESASASSEPIINAVRSQVQEVADQEFASTTSQPQVNEIESDDVLTLLNSASKTRLMKVSGIGEATARRIIEGRPYADVTNLIDHNILSEEILELKKLALETAENHVA